MLPNDSCTARPRARPGGRRRAPAGLLGGELQRAQRAAASSRAARARILRAGPARPRAAARRPCSPSRTRCACCRPSATTAPVTGSSASAATTRCVGDGLEVRRVGDALDRRAVDAVLDHHRLERRAGEDRLADDDVLPRRRACPSRRAPTSIAVHERGPVVAAADVVLARPHHLDRHARRPWRRARPRRRSPRRVRAPAEAAAEERGVDAHLLGRRGRGSGGRGSGRRSGTACRSRSRTGRRRSSPCS